MRVLLIGATGLIGRSLAPLLVGRGHDVQVLTRRATGLNGVHDHVAPAEQWPDLARRLGGEAAISCLGTTWRKAGSEAAFRAVDQDAVLAFARGAREGGARHMLTVSSVGADAGSRTFYLRVKGEVEESLRASGFDRLDIFRPGLLLGDRGRERRVGERLAILASPLTGLLTRGRLDRYAAVPAETVASAMAAAIEERAAAAFVHENRGIRWLVNQL